MAKTLLSRYLNPDMLARLTGRRIEPRGLVLGDTSRDMGEVLVDYLNHRSRLNRGR